MFFVTGTALAAVSVLLLGLCYIGVRNPKNSKWTGDFLVGSVYVPGIMMLLSFSAALFYWFAKDFDTHPLNAVQGGQALVVVIAAVAAWRLMGIGKKIKADRQKGSGTVINVCFQKENTTTPPASGGKAA
ncbi:MAG: hypothetical protein KKF12_20630 [Proteobacteria bacterium]|nr:hypothetical protein [Desulfobacula sp.]MBU3954463.1 hypothetical protein [Pseudomonadota bacterium]MBU4133233.1 hypothetical protein [Pseudomonadota bacterium]